MSEITRTELRAKEERLRALCTKVAEALRDSDDPYAKQIARDFQPIIDTLDPVSDLELKREAGRHIRDQFHKEGIQDRCPSAWQKVDWDLLVSELFDLSTLYVESRYAELFQPLNSAPSSN
ncbi:MAG: hypothetical protein HY298_25900 [Verrucomicrobia bacterium]|nr:hypothetical protein [Verrucomicrobiota bacterium]